MHDCILFQIDPKPCNPRTLQKPKRSSSYPKVFLGGLPSNVTETDLRTYFMRFGKVMEVVIMYDQEKKKSRGKYVWIKFVWDKTAILKYIFRFMNCLKYNIPINKVFRQAHILKSGKIQDFRSLL